jgi:hypothetical protein
MQLTPHLLLRSGATSSEVAIVLRDAGYHVTKVKDDELAMRTLGVVTVDAVVVELPFVATVAFLHRLATANAAPPVLALTVVPELLRRSAEPVATYDMRDGLSHLVSTTDLLLARNDLRKVS